MNLHIYHDELDWIIAESIKAAMAMQVETTGGDPSPMGIWFQLDDDSDLMIWLDELGDVSYGGNLVIGQASAWIESEGPGWLCSSEF